MAEEISMLLKAVLLSVVLSGSSDDATRSADSRPQGTIHLVGRVSPDPVDVRAGDLIAINIESNIRGGLQVDHDLVYSSGPITSDGDAPTKGILIFPLGTLPACLEPEGASGTNIYFATYRPG